MQQTLSRDLLVLKTQGGDTTSRTEKRLWVPCENTSGMTLEFQPSEVPSKEPKHVVAQTSLF